MPKVERAFCLCESKGLFLDVIEHQGRRWLVAPESASDVQLAQKPLRLICLEPLAFQEDPDRPVRYSLSVPIPTSVLTGVGQSPLDSDYEILELPL